MAEYASAEKYVDGHSLTIDITRLPILDYSHPHEIALIFYLYKELILDRKLGDTISFLE